MIEFLYTVPWPGAAIVVVSIVTAAYLLVRFFEWVDRV